MLVYISHPYGGKEENKKEIESIVEKLSQENPNIVYASPVHCFGFMYNTVSYERGLEMCLELLARSDKMLVYGDWKNSKGCKMELDYCDLHCIPHEIVED